jgi:hypothetical protein
MNKELAEMYGTAPAGDEETLQKQAAAELTEALSDDSGIDLNELTVDDVEAIAAEMLSEGESETEPAASEEGEEKLAEADYLGRVMAHSFWQEKTELEKDAANASERLLQSKGEMSPSPGKNSSKAERANFRKQRELGKGFANQADPSSPKTKLDRTINARGAKQGKVPGAKAGLKERALGQFGNIKKKVVDVAKKYPKSAIGLGALGAAGAGFGAAKAFGGEKKKAASAEETESTTPALDALTNARVNEILTANGIDPETLGEPAEKTAADEQVNPADLVNTVVEDRALATLEEMGFDVSALRGEEAQE